MIAVRTEQFHLSAPSGQIFIKRWLPDVDAGFTPLVLLHDSLGCVGLWKDFPAQLALQLQRPVIAYDRPGFGQSSPRSAFPSLNFIAEEATDVFPWLREQLGLKQYALLGHSVGGAMAVNIAAQDARCLGVITIASQPYIEELTRQGIRDAQALFAKSEQMAKLSRWHGDKASWVLQAWTDIWLADEYRHWNLTEVLHQLQCPLLVIHGDQDEYGSLAFPEFLAAHTGGPVVKVILQNCGHMPHREQTAEVIQVLKKFFSRWMSQTV